jgi:AAA15 family ATPase/GTPase
MQLKSFHVEEFQSVHDSGPIETGEITCLVGKNEAGKSALLRALYRLNPVVPEEGTFDVTIDYPRMEVEDYRHEVEAKKRKPAVPISACFALDDSETAKIREVFGPECLTKPELTLSKSYTGSRAFTLLINEKKSLEHLISQADFSEQTRESLSGYYQFCLEQKLEELVGTFLTLS